MQKPSDDKNHELADKLSFYFRDPGTTRATIPVSLASDIIAALRGELYVGGGWIHVRDRLPSPHSDNDYICASKTGYVTPLKFGEHGWYVEHEQSAKGGYWNGCITHWQPLPPAPTCENDKAGSSGISSGRE